MTLKDLQDKKFKWDWSHDYYYSDEFILNIKFRKCNHCGISYVYDMFQNVAGIKLFGSYKLTSLICEKCGTSLCNNGKLPNLKKETNPIQMSWFDGMEY